MVDTPDVGQNPWGEDLNNALQFLQGYATATAETARLDAITAVVDQINASRDRSTHTGSQDASTITGLEPALVEIIGSSVLTTTGDQSKAGVLTFLDAPIFPPGSIDIDALTISGTASATTVLHGDYTWRTAEEGGGNARGTLNNPETDANAPRPQGLTRVVWDTPTEPTNRQLGDFNLQQGL